MLPVKRHLESAFFEVVESLRANHLTVVLKLKVKYWMRNNSFIKPYVQVLLDIWVYLIERTRKSSQNNIVERLRFLFLNDLYLVVVHFCCFRIVSKPDPFVDFAQMSTKVIKVEPLKFNTTYFICHDFTRRNVDFNWRSNTFEIDLHSQKNDLKLTIFVNIYFTGESHIEA